MKKSDHIINKSQNKSTGLIFDIKKYSLHDGPGIRTTVFFKGCPLTCQWCCNPESQSFEPEIMWLEKNCINCNLCVEVCPEQGVISDKNGKKRIEPEICSLCGECVGRCPGGALQLVGRSVTVDEVIKEIEKDSVFYQRTGGGLTLSGGEPLAQPDFAFELLRYYKKIVGLYTAVETCGYTDWNFLERILKFTDLIYYDIKHINSEKHKTLTGAGNELILENVHKTAQSAKKMIVRLPLIPGCNDTENNIVATAEFIRNLQGKAEVEILPYHRLGEPKYKRLGKMYNLYGKNTYTREKLKTVQSIVEKHGLKVRLEGTLS